MEFLEKINMSDICIINILKFLPLEHLLGNDKRDGFCFLNKIIFDHIIAMIYNDMRICSKLKNLGDLSKANKVVCANALVRVLMKKNVKKINKTWFGKTSKMFSNCKDQFSLPKYIPLCNNYLRHLAESNYYKTKKNHKNCERCRNYTCGMAYKCCYSPKNGNIVNIYLSTPKFSDERKCGHKMCIFKFKRCVCKNKELCFSFPYFLTNSVPVSETYVCSSCV